jgi:hypothetical protein
MTDPLIRSNQWKRAYSEEGGLRDMFDDIRQAYFKRAGKLEVTLPADVRANALERLSFASNVLDMVEDHIRAIIDDGKIAEHNVIYAEKIAGVPERKRRFLNL